MRAAQAAALAWLSMSVLSAASPGQRIAVPARVLATLPAGASDTGPVAASSTMEVTLRLMPTADKVAALQQLLVDQRTVGTPNYRRWVTQAEFAAEFGATDAQIEAVTTWAQAGEMSVTSVSPSKLRLTVAGTAAQVEAAFGTSLHRIAVAGAQYVAATAPPTVPSSVRTLLAGVDGFDTMPVAAMTVTEVGGSGAPTPGDALAALEALADANTTATVKVTSAACSTELAQPDYDAYTAVLQQAEAEGITVVANNGCATSGAGGFPASLAEVTAVAVQGAETAAAPSVGIVARPDWQTAPGLPTDGERDAPDITVTSMDALTAALGTIQKNAGGRVGDINSVLYALGPLPGLYTQPDGAAAGTWETATGLGLVNLAELIKAFPDGTVGTSSNFQPSSFAVTHGTNITYTTIVTSTGTSGTPTGTVTFNAVLKGTTSPVTVIGTAPLVASGTQSQPSATATFTANQLAGGEYSVSSVYGGDGTFQGSTSGIATVSVAAETPVITPTVVAGAVVGGNITVNVTVTSASGVGTPSGTVIAAPQGTTNTATAQGTLTGSSGTATGTILLPIAQAGNFTLLIYCATTDPSFNCGQKISVQAPVGKGATTTVLSMTPTAPVTGGPLTLTATVAGVGNGPTPTGNIEFLDGTTGLQSVPLVNGVATYTGTVALGTHAYNASYGGDPNYTVSSSTTTSTSTGTTATTTTLTANNYAVAVGQSITFYASVFPVSINSTTPTPTGAMTITAATQGVIGTGTLIGGLATITLTLPAGTYNLTATYGGDSIYAGSASTSSVIVTVGTQTAVLTAAFTPATAIPYGTLASLTATAAVANSTVAPTGSVSVAIVGVAGANFTEPLVPAVAGGSSTATVTFPAPTPGTYTVDVSCPATGTLKCGTPITVSLVTVKGDTATALAMSTATPAAGVTTTLTATITDTGTAPGPFIFTGTVRFFANTTLLGTGVVSGNTATAVVVLPAGASETLTAVYSGDINWATSTSTGQTIALAQIVSSTVLTSNVASALAGVGVTLTATISPLTATANIAPTGTVTFFDTGSGVLTTLGTATLIPNGTETSTASVTTVGLGSGTQTIYAVYTGDTVYSASTSANFPLMFADYALGFTPTTLTVAQGQTGTVLVAVNPIGNFAGSISFSCTPPPNTDLTCAFSSPSLNGGGTTTLKIVTVAPSAAAALNLPWGVRGGAVLALLGIAMVPRRRRKMTPLIMILLGLVLSGAVGCGMGTSNLGAAATTSAAGGDPGSPLGQQIFSIVTAGSNGVNTIRHDYTYQVNIQ